jgi:hypothetical protein
VKKDDVLHRELMLESHSGMLEKVWARGGEDNEVSDLASVKPSETK